MRNELRHGHARRGELSKTYQAWRNMRARCTNLGAASYRNYGARGISVCPEWSRFEQFLADMGEAPAGLTLARKENSAGYSKNNCVWATRTTQQRNTRATHNITFAGKTQCVVAWAQELNIPLRTLHYRIRQGWTAEQILTTTPLLLTHNGITQSVDAWAKQMCVKAHTLYKRLRSGWSIESTLTLTPVIGRNQSSSPVRELRG